MKMHVYVTGKNFDGSTYKYEKDINGEETAKDALKELRLFQITIAKEVLQEEIAKGFDKGYVKRVDGTVGKSEEDVRILGKIEYIARVDFENSVMLVYEKLLAKSPVSSGSYRNAHVVFCNGKIVASNYSELLTWVRKVLPEMDFSRPVIVRFVNLAAYARRLETLGATIKGISKRRKTVRYRNTKHGGGSTRVAKMPNGTYYLVYRVVKSQLKALSGVGEGTRFEFITGDTFGIGDKSISRGFKRDKFVKSGRNYLYPSIVIELSKEASFKGQLQTSH